MKNSKRFKLISLLLVLAMALAAFTGCGKQAAEPAASEPAGSSEAPAAQGEKNGPEGGGPALSEMSSDEIYDLFLNDEFPVTVAIDAECLEKGKSYTVSDMVETVRAGVSEEMYELLLGDVLYSKIDCGADGEPELALSVSYVTPGDTYEGYEKLYVLKNYGGELKLISDDYSQSRSYADITDSGILCWGGSSSAMSYYMEYSYLNEKGEKLFLFSVEYNLGMQNPVIPLYDMPTGTIPDDVEYEEEFAEDEGLEIDIYNFTKYDSSRFMDDDYYDEYLGKNVYVFLDSEGSDIKPDSRYAQYYEDAGLDIVTENELLTRLNLMLTGEYGVDPNFIYEDFTEWDVLDPETTDWLPKG